MFVTSSGVFIEVKGFTPCKKLFLFYTCDSSWNMDGSKSLTR